MIRKNLLLVTDMAFVFIALFLTVGFHYYSSSPHEQSFVSARYWWMILLVYAVLFVAGRSYQTIWGYAGHSDILRTAGYSMLAMSLTVILRMLLGWDVPIIVLVMCGMLTAFFCCVARLAWRAFNDRQDLFNFRAHRDYAPVLIVGAGEGAAQVIGMCNRNRAAYGRPVVMVDDDPQKRNLRIQEVPVKGSLDDIPRLVEQYKVRTIIIAILSLKGDKLNQVVASCNATRCNVLIMTNPRNAAYMAKNEPPVELRKLNTSDFLSRDEVQLNMEGISGYLKDRTVLVTGGGGSIGSELCRQIFRFQPNKLIVFDIYENGAYELQCELQQQFGKDCPLVIMVGSIRDVRRLNEVMERFHPQVVFHAAAHKHVPLMEDCPSEAIKNNVLGTYNVLEACKAHGVKRFVAISTDKAVDPINVMGATKRVAEMLVQHYAETSSMKCMAVRFGNVLGSHGSVIPLFEGQILRGGPVTITHPDIERYFMTIPEAAQLVLQAGSMGDKGSIYILDMGEPVKIMDLAKKMIQFYGYTPGKEIRIEIVGLRPGEKITEELMMNEEMRAATRTEHSKIQMAPPIAILDHIFLAHLSDLFKALEEDDEAVVKALSRLVPSYQPAEWLNRHAS